MGGESNEGTKRLLPIHSLFIKRRSQVDWKARGAV